MKVTLNGQQHEITREGVERVANEEPRDFQRYYMMVEGRIYPIKQAASTGIGLPPIAFTSQQAYRWLTKLGFNIIDGDQER